MIERPEPLEIELVEVTDVVSYLLIAEYVSRLGSRVR
jgi:hypothetical protein